MKNIFPVAIILLFIFSCSKEEKNFVTIAGKIENANADSVYVVSENLRKAIALHEGEFADTLKIYTAGYFEFYSGRERTGIFLNPGDSLFVSTDMEEFDEKLKYGGTSANENNYLAQKYLKEESFSPDPAAFFSLPENEYKEKVSELKVEIENILTQSDVKKDFEIIEEKNIKYGYYLQLLQYPSAHQYFTQNEVELSKEIENELSKINLENEDDFTNIPNYQQFVFSKIAQKMGTTEKPDDIMKVISEIKSPKIKDAVMQEFLMYSIESGSPDAERYNDFIQKNAKDDKLKKESAEAFAKVQKLLPGKPSPKFSYPDINGKTVSLDDLKGNLVYIDVWATWCGPCIREIPALKQLESDYHGKKIAFVSMSIDPKEDFDKWQKMVKEKDLKGIQIFADNDWKSEFVQEYGIKGIPRFILVDQNGNILNADAPRPSDPEIRTLLDKHL